MERKPCDLESKGATRLKGVAPSLCHPNDVRVFKTQPMASEAVPGVL
jgi:hypothetical protein